MLLSNNMSCLLNKHQAREFCLQTCILSVWYEAAPLKVSQKMKCPEGFWVCTPLCPVGFWQSFGIKYHLEASRSVLFSCRSSAEKVPSSTVGTHQLCSSFYGWHGKVNALVGIQSFSRRQSSSCFLKMGLGFKAMHSPFLFKGCLAVHLTPLLSSTQISRAILLHN